MSNEDPKFYIGDTVMFNSVYNYPDSAAEGVHYKVVGDEDIKYGGWQFAEGINGYSKQIALDVVRKKPYDFILIERGVITHDVYDKIDELKDLVEKLRKANTTNVDSIHEVSRKLTDETEARIRNDSSFAHQMGDVQNQINEFNSRKPLEIYVDGVLRVRTELWSNDKPQVIELDSKTIPATGGLVGSDEIGLIGEVGTDFVMPMMRGLSGKLTPIPGAYLPPINVTVNNDGEVSSEEIKDQIGQYTKMIHDAMSNQPRTATDTCRELEAEEDKVAPIKSTGGSSSYYDLSLSDKLMNKLFDRWEQGNAHIRTEELIEEAFSDNFDFGTAFKSLVRAHGITKGGGKAGNDLPYECNKVRWYIDKIEEKNS